MKPSVDIELQKYLIQI